MIWNCSTCEEAIADCVCREEQRKPNSVPWKGSTGKYGFDRPFEHKDAIHEFWPDPSATETTPVGFENDNDN